MPPNRHRASFPPGATGLGTAGQGPAGTADPLAGVERVFIDGSNLLHALARGRPGGETGPAGAVIGRIRAAFPDGVILDLVFDGPAWGGIKGRLATGLRVAYSGRMSADHVIIEGVAAQLTADGPGATWGILVVTDDRGLRDLVRSKGARTAGTAWLAGRMGRLIEGEARRGGYESRPRGRGGPPPPLPKAGTTIGHRRPLRAPDAMDRDRR